MGSPSAVFVGDGSLLVRCAQAWLDAGCDVRLVASHGGEVRRWAEANGIEFAELGQQASGLAPTGCDYLFSVANLEVLPAPVLAAAGTLAINFHDGPLPRYAGLNAPAWALMAGETSHAITWHEMTAQVDGGRIVRQRAFAIEPGDTALTLNTRCYEAGLAAFLEICRDIVAGQLALAPQVGERSWFGRDRRPPLLGTLDVARPARELAALVRALDFGTYANPLARAKLLTRDGLLLVRQAHVVAPGSGAPAGTVLARTADSLQLATGEGDLLLAGLTTAAGEAPAALPGTGECLPLLDTAVRERLQARTQTTGRGERHWVAALALATPVELPYPRSARGGTERWRIETGVRIEPARTTAGCLAWIAALAGQERVPVLFGSAQLQQDTAGLQPWLAQWVPLTLDVTPNSTPGQLALAAQALLAATEHAGAMPRDLVTRLGAKPIELAPLARVALRFDPCEPPEHCEVLLSADAEGRLLVIADGAVYDRATAQHIAAHLSHWLEAFAGPDVPLAQLSLLPAAEAALLDRLDATAQALAGPGTIHEAIAAQAQRTPDACALEAQGETLTYAQLERRSAQLAARLAARGVGPRQVIGLALDRSAELVIALLATLKTGAAYLPLDPDYPAERIAFMVEDSGTPLVVTTSDIAARLAIGAARAFCIDRDELSAGDPMAPVQVATDAPAYVIYTSGSTGKPKGVVVTHGNVANFFAGMDARVAHDPPGRWLAVTSLSFDISVLELCWTLARGFTVVLHSHTVRARQAAPEFSLFYFASDHASAPQDRYRLLMEGAKFADQNGFAAVWTPERHFHAFGGLYPNPAVTSAAIAACTSRVQIRAGSCVLPLHHPIRVAEEWAFVDNISQGRVGISFAAGWQPNDFVIAPDAFADRKRNMLANIEVVRRLWRGEQLPFPGPDGKPVSVQTLPRPIQPELPVWVTAAGNPETFAQAGELGCHLLTHLLGQSVEEVAEKLRAYRMAWHRAGHPGQGRVTLMLHTFVGDDDAQVREIVRGPMKEYLRSSVDLIRQAAWSFPTFVQRAARDGRSPVEIMESAPLSDDELDALLEHAFARYYSDSGLFGTRERCLAMVQRLQAAGVDEIACLIDFGIETQRVLDHLPHVKGLMEAARALQPGVQRVSVAEEIARQRITHMQCTPSMASMLLADAPGREALGRLQALLVGGEALPLRLATELRALVPGQLVNMYGPTETTIWCTTCELRDIGDFVPLGQAIANTRLRVRSPWGAQSPALVPGELLIGGAGVASGYWKRPELTDERFIEVDGARWYRTGDLVRRHPDGRLEFLGRLDHQVKIRGHRIELGEVESVLARQPGVKDAVVIARADAAGEQRLLAYVTPQPGARPDAELAREALARELPAVMVPQSVVLLQALPVTPNGKVDRRALPEPQAIPVLPAGTSPESELEKTIAAIWQDVLGVPQVRTRDNFFDLGGHSLLVVQVQRRLREACGREVSITDMFRLPTIESLAAHLGGSAPAPSAVGDGLQRAQARRMMRSRTASTRAA